ncbi:porin family protein [Sinomicrobium sp.]
MLRIVLYVTLVTMTFIVQNLKAQTPKDSLDTSIKEELLKTYKQERERIVSEEKSRLKKEVERIQSLQRGGEITADEAQRRKEQQAKRSALNIENRLAILENKMALAERGEYEKYRDEGNEAVLRINFGAEEEADGDRLFGVVFDSGNKKKKYDKKTTSNLVIGIGLNNAIIEGQSLNDSPYKTWGSRFFELGWQWKTRLLKNSNAVRVSYGLSLHSNGLKPKDNQYFVSEGAMTSLESFPHSLKKSKFRQDHLVVPLFFEFGPSEKKEYDDYFRYSTDKKFKVGIGGYVGASLSSRQKLRYRDENRSRSREKLKGDYNTNDFVYGLAAYVGRGDMSVYLKYDLSPIFKNPNPEQRNISLGLRFEL